MNILNKLLFVPYFLKRSSKNIVSIRLSYNSSCNFAIKPRPNDVPTHKNEFKPFTINNLWDNPGAKKKNIKRLGRGLGNGKGKTAGKGTKGQGARAGGGVHHRFEGGQAPLQRRLPKIGSFRQNKERPSYLNLSKVIEFIEKERLDKNQIITIKAMRDAKMFKKATFGIKLLSRGVTKIDFPLNIEVTSVSQNALNAGGTVTCVYRTKLKMREHLFPEKFPFKLNEPLPASKNVKKLEKLREMGVNVIYNEPKWIKEEKNKIQEEKIEIKEKPKKISEKEKEQTKKPREKLIKQIDLKL